MVRQLLSIGLLLTASLLIAQAPQIITSTEVTPKRGYVGEPRLLSITVLSETYFTAPVSITNLKIAGAFLVQRQNTPTTVRKDGQTYAGVIIKFYIFPYEEGSLEIPSVTFTTQSPPPGDYRGKEVVVRTGKSDLFAAPVPPNVSKDQWIVANNLTIKESWDRPLKDLKVGDVVTRSFTISVSNTLSEFIPEIAWLDIAGMSLYPQAAQLENKVTKTVISGKRSERISYLLEDTGTVKIPQLQMQFYHPGRRRFTTRSVPGYTIQVGPNDDLGLVASMKDSLAAYLADQALETSREADGIEVTRDQWLLMGVSLVILWAFWRWRVLSQFIRYIKRRRHEYVRSEPYYFAQLMKGVDPGDGQKTLKALYRYLDEVRPPGYDATVRSIVADTALYTSYSELISSLYQEGSEAWRGRHLRKQVRSFRKHTLGRSVYGSKAPDSLSFNPE